MSDSRSRRGRDDRKDGQNAVVDAINGIQKTLNACCCCIIKKLDEIIDGKDNGNQKKACLCVATSACAVASKGDTEISVTLPANSCITKIYTSGKNGIQFDSILVTVNNGTGDIFCYRFYLRESLGLQEDNFETTLVQPLCVGSEEATVTAKFEGGCIDEGTLTVVYCEECCLVE